MIMQNITSLNEIGGIRQVDFSQRLIPVFQANSISPILNSTPLIQRTTATDAVVTAIAAHGVRSYFKGQDVLKLGKTIGFESPGISNVKVRADAVPPGGFKQFREGKVKSATAKARRAKWAERISSFSNKTGKLAESKWLKSATGNGRFIRSIKFTGRNSLKAIGSGARLIASRLLSMGGTAGLNLGKAGILSGIKTVGLTALRAGLTGPGLGLNVALLWLTSPGLRKFFSKLKGTKVPAYDAPPGDGMTFLPLTGDGNRDKVIRQKDQALTELFESTFNFDVDKANQWHPVNFKVKDIPDPTPAVNIMNSILDKGENLAKSLPKLTSNFT